MGSSKTTDGKNKNNKNSRKRFLKEWITHPEEVGSHQASRLSLTLPTDLAPSNFWLFPKLKKKLRVCHFEDVKERKEAVTSTLDTFTLKGYKGALKILLEH